MREIILKVKSEYDFVYEEVYIENDKAIFEMYKEKIPVLMIDNKMFAKYTVNEEKFRKRILTGDKQ